LTALKPAHPMGVDAVQGYPELSEERAAGRCLLAGFISCHVRRVYHACHLTCESRPTPRPCQKAGQLGVRYQMFKCREGNPTSASRARVQCCAASGVLSNSSTKTKPYGFLVADSLLRSAGVCQATDAMSGLSPAWGSPTSTRGRTNEIYPRTRTTSFAQGRHGWCRW
jgi:hypothetical protein